MQNSLEFTGERFIPGQPGEIALEHWHRYAFARRFVAGKRVLDVASGEGYGSALLAAVADSVVGVDVDPAAVAHAHAAYAARANLRFEVGSAAALPLLDCTVDVVVSFETIEHLPQAMQPQMLAEIARVLTPAGVLVLSAPNPVEYSDARAYRNPFHVHEPDRAELDAMLAIAFPMRRWFRQRDDDRLTGNERRRCSYELGFDVRCLHRCGHDARGQHERHHSGESTGGTSLNLAARADHH